jgi:hypothetical protein
VKANINKSIKIDFYQIQIENQNVNFSNIIEQVAQTANDSTRNEDKGEGVLLRLQELNRRKELKIWQGEMIRIRMNDLPLKINVDGKVDDLDLDEDEGIGDETAFLFDESTNILVIQRNRNAVTASSFAWYFGKKSGEQIGLLPLMNDTALKRMAQMSEHRRLEIALAKPQQFKEFADKNLATGALTGLMKYFESLSLHLTVSMGRSDGSLAQVVSFAKFLYTWAQSNPDEVKSITVSGTSDEGSEIIDLLADRLVETHVVTVVERKVSSESVRNAVYEAWIKRKQYLKYVYSVYS